MTPSLPLWEPWNGDDPVATALGSVLGGGSVVGPDFATPLAGRGYNKGKRPTLTAC